MYDDDGKLVVSRRLILISVFIVVIGILCIFIWYELSIYFPDKRPF